MGFLDRLLRRTASPVAEVLATEVDVLYAYRLVLGREPDPSGLAHYRALIAQGLTRQQLTREFFHSDEYRQRAREQSRPTAVDLGDYRVCVHELEPDFGQAIFHSHDYEPHVRQAVRDHVREGDIVVDVGANVGAIALLAATLVKASGRVLAIEPNPDNVQLLYRGIVLNGLTNVEVLPFAASNRRAVFALTGGPSNTYLVTPGSPVEAGFLAQSIVLDEALRDLPRVDFLKMDIEGHEPQAWEGFATTIARCRPTLLVEFNPRCLADLQQQDPHAFLRQIFAGYSRVRASSVFGYEGDFDDADHLMRHWDRRNREVASHGRMPDRMLHFDLLAVGR